MSDAIRGFATRAIQAVTPPECATPPIYMGVTNFGEYTRDSNPTLSVFESAMMELEGGAGAISTACGMAAIAQTLMSFLTSGSKLVIHRCVYTSVMQWIEGEVPKLGVECVWVDMRDLDALKEALKDGADVVYTELLANPNMDIIDIEAVAVLAREAGAKLVVDNTFTSPYLHRPLEWGADVVVHSATKYLSGCGDVLGGVITTADAELAKRIRFVMTLYGGVISPIHAYLLMRGIKTLALRMEAATRNAAAIAELLEGHPKVEFVRYPGLASTRGHEIASRLMLRPGGLLAFRPVGGLDAAYRFAKALTVVRNEVSLGDAQSLAGVCPGWEPAGIEAGLIRISAGLENVEDLLADIEQALGAV
jgi:methionine-gamma-lyase